jgi:IS30 family transposase
LCRHACRSITFDRGSEFVDWPHLQAEVGTQTWFCEAQSLWQKGAVENANKRLRRW